MSEEDVPALDRGFARLVAEEMRPFMRPAMDESVREALREFMGQNGEQHKADHAEIAELRKKAIAKAEAEKKKQEEDARNAEESKRETRRFRLQVLGSLIAVAAAQVLNLVFGK